VGQPRGWAACAHGLTGDRCGPAEILSRWARELAEAGHGVVRFDFRGSGDSPGSWAATTFAGMVSDFTAVIDWMRSQLDGSAALTLAGLSTGGVIAAATAAGRCDVAGLLLMSSDFWEEPEPAVFIEPVRAGEFHEPPFMPVERAQLHAHGILARLAVPKMLIFGDQDTLLVAELPKLRRCGVSAVPVAGTGHLFEGESERRELSRLTRDFLESVLT
jgi:pimeloyl-ACP methyl ester carboxylesterase